MRTKQTTLFVTGLLAVLALPASAVVTFSWAVVGDVGNSADPYTGRRYGAVDYEFKIAKHEVTIGQYTEFLNAAAAVPAGSYQENLWNPAMENDVNIAGITRSGSGTVGDPYTYAVSGSPNRPVTYVSWFDAARFTNWVNNGQRSGSTETGVYELGGAESGIFMAQPSATVWIPTENEWYKAAFYQPAAAGGDADSYWLYPTASNTVAGNTIGVADSANYHDGDFAQDQNGLSSRLTEVGAYGINSTSYYGTFDQGGNVWEWNDAVISSARGMRGGSWANSGSMRSTNRGNNLPTFENTTLGFRIATVPEPSAVLLLLTGGALGFLRRRRSAH